MKTRVHDTNSTNMQIIKDTYNQHLHQYALSEAKPNQEDDSSSEEMYDDSNSDKINVKSEFAAEECIPDDGLDLYEEQTVESSYSGLTDYNILKDLVAQSVKNEGELMINTSFIVEDKLEGEVNEGNLIKHEYDEVDPNEYEVEHQIQTIAYEEHDDIVTQEEKTFSCEQCSIKFESPKDLLNHKKVHDDKPFRCQICFRQFRKEMGMKVHITLKHGKQRSKNDLNFDVKNKRKPNISKKRGRKNDTNCGQRYECIDCLRSFEQLNYLKNHLKFHNDRKSKPFECGICFKCYGQRGNLDTHKKIHLGHKQFKCHLCTREFFQKGNLTTHLKIHEQAEKELQRKLKLMKRAKLIKAEVKTEPSVPQTQLNVKRFTCEVCSKSFVQLTNLQTHMRTHTGSRPYSCSFCSKTFTQLGNLQKHLKIHTGERPFKCEVCSKAFVQKCQLQKHMNVHSTGQHVKKGRKPMVPRIKVFQCKNCSKKYKQNVNLKKHMEKCINTTTTNTTIQQKPAQANTKQIHFEKITNLKNETDESECHSDSSDNASVSGNASTDSSNDSSGSAFGNSYYD